MRVLIGRLSIFRSCEHGGAIRITSDANSLDAGVWQRTSITSGAGWANFWSTSVTGSRCAGSITCGSTTIRTPEGAWACSLEKGTGGGHD